METDRINMLMDTKADFQQILDVAQAAARNAAQLILSHWDNLKIDYKAINDLVTQADVAAEKLIKEIVLATFPSHSFFAKESDDRARLDSEHLWVVDPLDGTTNFANQLPHFCVSIAYSQRGIVQVGVVYDVVKDEMFYAIRGQGTFLNNSPIHVSGKAAIDQAIVCTGFAYERGELMRHTLGAIQVLFENNLRGLRRMGAAALDFCWVACGRLDGYFEYSLKPWDFAAGALIVQEAGGKVVNHFGEPLSLQATGAIIAGPSLLDALCQIVVYPQPTNSK